MASTTGPAVYARINTLIASAPYAFQRATEPFSFDLQPNTHIDLTYCLLAASDQITGYLGYAQAQIDRLTLRLARRIGGFTPDNAVNSLYADVSSFQASIVRDGVLADYSGEVVDWSIQTPRDKDTFAVAELTLTVDYDRAL